MSEIYTGHWVGKHYVSEVDYQAMYEREKSRADELENRWNDLRARVITVCRYDTPIGKQYNRAFLCLMDEVEGKENVFETVQEMEDEE